MKLDITTNTAGLDDMLRQFPSDMRASMELFVDRVGYKLDNQAKKAAPVITGNLRRNIQYSDRSVGNMFTNGVSGEVTAHAKYSKYVHGQPYYENKMRRKETPFFTNALATSETFIKNEAKAMVQRVLK